MFEEILEFLQAIKKVTVFDGGGVENFESNIKLFEKFLIMKNRINNNVSNTTFTHTTLTDSCIFNSKLVDVKEGDDYIELIYTHEPLYWTSSPNVFKQVYKIKYCCIDGKWNKSNPIYGKYIPASGESYEFNE